MRTMYPATRTYQRLALLHNALTLAWLALPAAIVVLTLLDRWPWALACLLLDIGIDRARSWTFQAARRHHHVRPQPWPWRKKSRHEPR